MQLTSSHRSSLIVEDMGEVNGSGDVGICFFLRGAVHAELGRSLKGAQAPSKVGRHDPQCGIFRGGTKEDENDEVV